MTTSQRLASRMDRLNESKTLRMSRLSREMKEEGIDVISLSIGEPDFETPPHIIEAAKKAMEEGYTHYPPVSGYNDLRKAIATKYKTNYGYPAELQNVLVSTGAKQSLANLAMALIDEGDQVLIPAPYWVTYTEQIQLAGGEVVSVQAGVEQEFKMRPEDLKRALEENDRIRMLIFSSPSNPTGSVYSMEELAAFAEILVNYPNVIIVSDEIYEHINFIGEHNSISAFPEIHDQLVIVNGVSKGYAMTGWRIGYIIAPLWLVKACEKLQGQFTSGANSIAQRAALAAIEGEMEATVAMRDRFLERRDWLLEQFKSLPQIKMNVPEGAFYLFMDVSEYFGTFYGDYIINSSEDLAMYLLKEAHVSLVAGDAFGTPECIRISYAASMDQLEEAFRRLKSAFSQLS